MVRAAQAHPPQPPPTTHNEKQNSITNKLIITLSSLVSRLSSLVSRLSLSLSLSLSRARARARARARVSSLSRDDTRVSRLSSSLVPSLSSMALASLQRRPGAPDVGQSPRLVRSRRGFPRGCHCPPLPARLSLTPAAAGGYGACLSGRNGQLRAREGGGGAGACTCVLSCPLRDHEHEEGSRPRRSRGPGWRTCRVPGRAASRVWVGTSSLRPSVSRARERVRQRVSATRENRTPILTVQTDRTPPTL